MKASLVDNMQYLDVIEKGLSVFPPVPPACFDSEVARRSVQFGLELCDMADELGFDWVSLIEHHYSPRQLTPNPLLLAASLAPRLRHAKIAILGSTLPLLNPVRLAEEYAMLDLLSGGRVIAGLIRGTAPEYTTYGTNPAESRGRYEEGVELILKAWTEPQPFGWEGEYYRFRTVSIWPRPVQQPHPPVFVSGNSRESGSLAARHHLGLALSFQPLPEARALVQHYRDEAARGGWTPTADDIVVRGFVYVAETDAQAEAEAETYTFGLNDGGRGLRANVRDMIGSGGVATVAKPGTLEQEGVRFFGNPDTVARKMRRLQDEVGAGTLDGIFISGRMPREKVHRSVELFGSEVLPQVRDR